MKMIIAYIRPEQLPEIKNTLFEADLRHFTATVVLGTAPKTEQQMYRGVEREVTLFRRVRLELIVKEALVENAINALTRGAMDSGGYGKLFITNIDEVVKIWTGERGLNAL